MSEAANIILAVSQLWPNGPELFGSDWPNVRQQLLLKVEYLETHSDEDNAVDTLLAVFDDPRALLLASDTHCLREQISSVLSAARQGHLNSTSIKKAILIAPQLSYLLNSLFGDFAS